MARVLSNKEQERMVNNGWRLMLADSYSETESALYARLSEKWEKVKIYESTTQIRGLHSMYAMCKGKKQ